MPGKKRKNNLSALSQLMTLYAGGPGSGCHGENCGRPKTELQSMLENIPKLWGENNLWAKLAKYGHAGNIEPFTKTELDRLNALKKAAGYGKKDCEVGFCFMNAQRLAMAAMHDKNVQLVEGLVTVHGVPIDHSWVEYNGKVFDPTLANYKGDKEADYSKVGRRSLSGSMPEYHGVVVPKEEIAKFWLSKKTYSPLSHEHGNESLQRKIWK